MKKKIPREGYIIPLAGCCARHRLAHSSLYADYNIII